MTVVESPKGRASHNLGNRGAIPPFPPPGYCYIFFQNLSRKESSSPPAPSRFRLILRLEKTSSADCASGSPLPDLQPLQKCLGLVQLREQPLFCLEFRPVNAAAAAPQLHGMLEVQHLVIDDVLHSASRYPEMIENPADHNGVVCGVIVGQTAARANLAPGHLRAPQQSVKEPQVELVEDLLQVVEEPTRRMNAFAPAHLPHQMRFGADVLASHVTAKSARVRRLDRLAVYLGQQNMHDRLDNAVRCAFQQVRDSHVHLGVAQADGVVHVCEGIELDTELRQRSAWPQFAVTFLENFVEIWPQSCHYRITNAAD